MRRQTCFIRPDHRTANQIFLTDNCEKLLQISPTADSQLHPPARQIHLLKCVGFSRKTELLFCKQTVSISGLSSYAHWLFGDGVYRQADIFHTNQSAAVMIMKGRFLVQHPVKLISLTNQLVALLADIFNCKWFTSQPLKPVGAGTLCFATIFKSW